MLQMLDCEDPLRIQHCREKESMITLPCAFKARARIVLRRSEFCRRTQTLWEVNKGCYLVIIVTVSRQVPWRAPSGKDFGNYGV
jgi:hypothetical protein